MRSSARARAHNIFPWRKVRRGQRNEESRTLITTEKTDTRYIRSPGRVARITHTHIHTHREIHISGQDRLSKFGRRRADGRNDRERIGQRVSQLSVREIPARRGILSFPRTRSADSYDFTKTPRFTCAQNSRRERVDRPALYVRPPRSATPRDVLTVVCGQSTERCRGAERVTQVGGEQQVLLSQ